MDITADLINSLADKIDAIELTGDERMLLDSVLARAAMSEDDEVTGFAFRPMNGLSGLGQNWGAALGVLGSPQVGGAVVEYGSFGLEYGTFGTP